jgi:hypothetical protein
VRQNAADLRQFEPLRTWSTPRLSHLYPSRSKMDTKLRIEGIQLHTEVYVSLFLAGRVIAILTPVILRTQVLIKSNHSRSSRLMEDTR